MNDVERAVDHDISPAQGLSVGNCGVGASVPRREDDRFLRGRAQYVADVRMAGMRDVAFVRSPVAHARLRAVRFPAALRGQVFVAADLAGVKAIESASDFVAFKRSAEPILAEDKLCYVGEVVAMCVAPTRAQAEDVAAEVTLEYDELPPITDMLDARKPGASRVHDAWADNVFIEVREERNFNAALDAAPIKVRRRIRTSRQCAFPLEGSGVVAYWDARLRLLTVISSTRVPHTVQRCLADCLGVDDGCVRVISPDVGGGFGFKCVVRREEVAVAWLARRLHCPVRWLQDCREHLIANAHGC